MYINISFNITKSCADRKILIFSKNALKIELESKTNVVSLTLTQLYYLKLLSLLSVTTFCSIAYFGCAKNLRTRLQRVICNHVRRYLSCAAINRYSYCITTRMIVILVFGLSEGDATFFPV